MNITNLVLWVQENKLAEKFYKKLGFDVLQSTDEHSIVALGGFELDLVNMRDEELFAQDALAADKGRGVYIYVRVDNVDATHDALIAKGLTPATTPKNWPWGKREFIVKDPDGYKLCFWQPVVA